MSDKGQTPQKPSTPTPPSRPSTPPSNPERGGQEKSMPRIPPSPVKK